MQQLEIAISQKTSYIFIYIKNITRKNFGNIYFIQTMHIISKGKMTDMTDLMDQRNWHLM